MSHLRKTNLPLDPTAKIVGPRLLNGSQWGFIDPIDTPDGGNVGLHKTLAISARVSRGSISREIFINLSQLLLLTTLTKSPSTQRKLSSD